MVDALGDTLQEAEAAIELPKEFVVPGETRVSAALELARTTARRAERRTVTLAAHDGGIAEGHILAYLNRLADLLWVLARVAEQADARGATMARPNRTRGRRAAASTHDTHGSTE
jgi:cob(I)alamin adenosyltransferase